MREPVKWRKSSYSGGGQDCVEVAAVGGTVAVRDSKDPDGGRLVLSPRGWAQLAAVARSAR